MKKVLYILLMILLLICVGCSKQNSNKTDVIKAEQDTIDKDKTVKQTEDSDTSIENDAEEKKDDDNIARPDATDNNSDLDEVDKSNDTTEDNSLIVKDKAMIDGMSEDILKNMTLEEKIGQMFIVNFESLDTSNDSYFEWRKLTNKMRKSLDTYHVGGVVFFSRNIDTREQTMKFITDLQNKSKVPLFISVDEEGGDVSRIASNSNMQTTVFPSMQVVGELDDVEYANTIGKTIGKEIKALGFNLDFAPVADVKTNDANTEIGNRSFGSNPDAVADMVREVVKGLQSENVSATLKHFPGHGNASKDSHKGSVNVENDLERLRKIDFVPFKSGIKAGVDFIMVSHISISRVTEDTVPASLSSLVLKNMIRTELGFDGIVITDALNMKAITDNYSSKEAAVRAIKSGADMLLMPENLKEAYEGLLDAVNKGIIKESRIDDSLRRILKLKLKRGIILSDTNLIPGGE